MPDRLRLGVRIPLIPLLGVLATLMVAPERPAGLVVKAACLGGVRSASEVRPAPGQPTISLRAQPTTFAVPRVNALRSETEEQDGVEPLDGLHLLPLSFLSFHQHLDSWASAPRPHFSPYPLRC